MSDNGTERSAITSVLGLRLPIDERTALEEKAKAAGMTLSDWAKETLLGTPTYNPQTQNLRQVLLDETLEHYLNEGAKEYAEFLKAAERLFAPLAHQMSNHREWMRATLTGFSAEVSQQVAKVTEAIDRHDQQAAALLKESDRRFYARWIYVCLAAFLISAVSGFAVGYWRP